MDIVFLGAALPLTKTIVHHNGAYTVAPYPQVTKLTSFHTTAKNLREFYELLAAHAKVGHCLFNGQLTQPLVAESRQNKTKHGVPREWVVFDFDKVPATDAEDAIKKFLPDYCQNVSCIVQLSASMFLPTTKLFSGHVFMRLAKPLSQERLIQWFEWLNFYIPSLSGSLTLTESGLALHWPLDRTAAFDSKLIYISPPKCRGFSPPIQGTESLQIFSKPKTALTIPEFTPVDRSQISSKINELRTQAGLPPREFHTRKFEDGEVLLNAEAGVVHDVKAIGDHFIKFNLNGGDSYGYWIDLRNPAIIKNFKGEPYLLTKEIDEKFYQALTKQAGRIVAGPALEEGSEVLAFFATNRGATVTTGIFSPTRRELRLDDSTQSAAAAWLAGFGIVRMGHMPHYDIVFDPQSDLQYVAGHPVINTYRATDYMLQEKTKETVSTVAEIPPTIKKIVTSMLGDTDGTLVTHFTNWLAFIFQTRKKTGTSWLLHGTQGTGKSMFVSKVLGRLFGDETVRSVQFSLAQTQFNSFLEGSLFVVFEEATLTAVENDADLMMKLKHWTTDSPVEIHVKGKSPVKRPNYSNFIFNSNERNPIKIDEGERRINVANRQEKRLFLTPNEMIILETGAELAEFADVLKRWKVNQEQVRTLVKTEAASLIHEQTTSINQLIAEAILRGDIQFLLDRMPTDTEAEADFHNRFNPLPIFKDLLDQIIAGKKTVLGADDLFILFRTLIPDTRFFQDSKTWRMRHFNSLGLILKNEWAKELGKSIRGIKPTWQKPSEIPASLEKKHTAVPVTRIV